VHPTHETPLVWHTSSYCTGGAACVEIAALPEGGAAIRRSGDPVGTELCFTGAAWADFLAGARAGEFDPLSGPGEESEG
jgi:hypothetical protein